ncbi:MAG: S1 RNA-binding domain-containing protein [Cyanobacteria bacterium]|nr:S1 RNA-binding domain-containing protein [Cyanobacteriota bacterium]
MSTRTVEPSEILENNELRDDFAQLLEQSFQTELRPGAVTVGEIIRVEKDGLLVDVGGKSEGFVPLKEIPNCFNSEDLEAQFQAGQIKDLYVMAQTDDEVQYLLSIRRVASFKSWDKLKELKDANTTVEVTVTGATKGGILVSVMELKGFIPASQLRVAKTLDELAGDTLLAKILEVDKSKNKLILSNRAAVFEQKAEQRAETLKKINQGDVVEGEIVKITDFGVFVDINGIDGLLPLSEISWRRIHHPSEVLELGQRITVSVLTVDQSLQRISLSKKRLEQDPWETVDTIFKVSDVLNGRVSKALSSGVLVELTPGVEAYCSFNSASGRFFNINDTYQFRIVSMMIPDRRITLECLGDAQ